MLEDLKDLSEDYIRENREMARRGYQGSLMQDSSMAGLPNKVPGVPYGESQTSRRQDAALQDSYMLESRYASQPGYSSAPTQSGYPSAATGFPDGSRYPLPRLPDTHQCLAIPLPARVIQPVIHRALAIHQLQGIPLSLAMRLQDTRQPLEDQEYLVIRTIHMLINLETILHQVTSTVGQVLIPMALNQETHEQHPDIHMSHHLRTYPCVVHP